MSRGNSGILTELAIEEGVSSSSSRLNESFYYWRSLKFIKVQGVGCTNLVTFTFIGELFWEIVYPPTSTAIWTLKASSWKFSKQLLVLRLFVVVPPLINVCNFGYHTFKWVVILVFVTSIIRRLICGYDICCILESIGLWDISRSRRVKGNTTVAEFCKWLCDTISSFSWGKLSCPMIVLRLCNFKFDAFRN